MLELMKAFKYFEVNLLPESMLKRQPECQENIQEIIKRVSNEVFADADLQSHFKNLPKIVHCELAKACYYDNMFDLLCREAQIETFNNPAYKQAVEKHLCLFTHGDRTLEILENLLPSDQMTQVLQDISEEQKNKINTLDLSKTQKLENLEGLKGFSKLTDLILPHLREMNNLEGIGLVGLHLSLLDIQQTGIKTLDFLKFCPHLTVLKANEANRLNDINGLLHCKNIEVLILPTYSSIMEKQKTTVLSQLVKVKVSYD